MLSLPRLAVPLLAVILVIGPAVAQEPGPLNLEGVPAASSKPAVSMNQQLAERIALELRSSGQLRNYRIDVTFAEGTAELDGHVTDAAQRDEAVRLTQSVSGVQRVRDRLNVTETRRVAPTQFEQPREPVPARPLAQEPLGPPRPLPPEGLPQEPLPSFRMMPPAHGGHTGEPPFMPPYAWPTYAPYNNYSRVAYPCQYPCDAFPYIGPFYPFPKAPLGWRKVVLEFDDGHWWMSTKAQQRDWWSVRYW